MKRSLDLFKIELKRAGELVWWLSVCYSWRGHKFSFQPPEGGLPFYSVLSPLLTVMGCIWESMCKNSCASVGSWTSFVYEYACGVCMCASMCALTWAHEYEHAGLWMCRCWVCDCVCNCDGQFLCPPFSPQGLLTTSLRGQRDQRQSRVRTEWSL